jgi:hypothetical protein
MVYEVPVNELTNTIIDTSKNWLVKPKQFDTKKAQWDTGAQRTCITNEVATTLGLKPIMYGLARGINDETPKRVPIYRVKLRLPGDNEIPILYVFEGQNNGWDILLGMDVIQMGDFAVSNYENISKFTFRMPSEGIIDYSCK